VAAIIEIDGNFRGSLYNNVPNQIKRAIGKYSHVFVGEQCGTVRSLENGQCYDWWYIDEKFADGWQKIRLVPAE